MSISTLCRIDFGLGIEDLLFSFGRKSLKFRFDTVKFITRELSALPGRSSNEFIDFAVYRTLEYYQVTTSAILVV